MVFFDFMTEAEKLAELNTVMTAAKADPRCGYEELMYFIENTALEICKRNLYKGYRKQNEDEDEVDKLTEIEMLSESARLAPINKYQIVRDFMKAVNLAIYVDIGRKMAFVKPNWAAYTFYVKFEIERGMGELDATLSYLKLMKSYSRDNNLDSGKRLSYKTAVNVFKGSRNGLHYYDPIVVKNFSGFFQLNQFYNDLLSRF